MVKRFFLIFCVVCPTAFAEDAVNSDAEKKARLSAEEPTLFLESTLVGDKEQPTVSYFIPWKGTGTPDNLHWNLEQKNDRTLDVIDRDIMVRSMSIYNELNMENVPAPE
ncbi:MAG: hypothetical protein K6L80_02660 [Agarilytica sp.]